MSHTENPINNHYFYQLFIILIITMFASFKCYSMNNNEIQAQERLPLNVQQHIKQPPSYESIISNNSEILPTYQQPLAIIAQRNAGLIEAKNSNYSKTTIVNITNKQADSIIINNNCFCNYLKKHKKKILITALPYSIILSAIITIGTLKFRNVIDTDTFVAILFPMFAIIMIYALIERCLIKKFITNAN